ncbi:MAG: hypothetical protein ACXAAN_16230 [Candidatus Thorarchaeota archaeon]|jgi:hypothetical protein
MKMERVVEPESKKIEFDVLTETKEEVAITGPTQKARRIYRAPTNMSLYAQPLAGFAVIVALLFVPMTVIPGMVILVLVAEIYLLDWTYSKVSLIRDAKSAFSNESAERSPEDEIDRKIARPGPKDQFIR